MHCSACEKLIMMELEEAGLDQYVDHVEIFGEEKKGIFYLTEQADEGSIEKMKDVINGMEGYTIA